MLSTFEKKALTKIVLTGQCEHWSSYFFWV